MLREWMDHHRFENLRVWLAQSAEQLETLFEAGAVPVVGWLQLAEKISSPDAWKSKLEAELDENAREHEEIELQIKKLQEKQETLEKRNAQIREEIDSVGGAVVLQSVSEAIGVLGKKEASSVAKVDEKLGNAYSSAALDLVDVSTLFSMFEMDALFSRFQKNAADNNLTAILTAPVADVQNRLELDLPEAVELQWKLNLLVNREKTPSASHSLLGEYRMLSEDDRTQLEEKIKNWKGVFLTAALKAKLAGFKTN